MAERLALIAGSGALVPEVIAAARKKGFELKLLTISRKQRFDFGFIECDDVEPQIRLVDGVKCFSCHKNKGPILGAAPWTNTTDLPLLRAIVVDRFKLEAAGFEDPWGRAQRRRLSALLFT